MKQLAADARDRVVVLSLLLCAAACQRDFTVPPPKVPPVVGVDAVSPLSGWAGQRITIRGHDLGKTISDVEVRFGESSRTGPVSIAADASSLEVLVPDDATDGAVVVSVPLGQATSPQPFHFLGLGRLRQGSILAAADLRIGLTDLVGVGTNFAVLAPDSRWAGTGGIDSSTWSRLEVKLPVALAWSSGAEQVFAVDADPGACAGAVGQVVRPGGSSSPEPVCLPGNPADVTLNWQLAADGPGAHVVATTGKDVWLVDFSAQPAVVRTASATSSGAGLVAWAGGDHFLLVDDDGVKPITFSDEAPVGAALDTVTTNGPAAIDVSFTANVAAFCDSANGVSLLDLGASWPPVPRAGVPSLLSFACFGLALSPDASRVAISQQDKVTLLDTSKPAGPWLTMVSVPLQGASQVLSTPEVFLVAALGGVAELSLETGAQLGFIPLTAGLSRPIVRQVADGTVVELTRATVDTLVRLEAATFNGLAFPGGFSNELSLDAPNVDGLASDGKSDWLLHGYEVRKLSEPDGGQPSESAEKRWGPGTSSRTPGLSVSADGRAVFLHYNHKAWYLPPAWGISVLDPSVPWGASYQPPSIDTQEGTFSSRVVTDLTGNAWLIAGKTVSPLDLTGALLGSGAGAPIELDDSPATAATALGALFVAQVAPLVRFTTALWRIAPDGTVVKAKNLPGYNGYDGDMVLSVSGRRLYFLRLSGTQRQLITAIFDPYTGETGDELPPIPLPYGASALVPFADGSRMLVVDQTDDALFLLE